MNVPYHITFLMSSGYPGNQIPGPQNHVISSYSHNISRDEILGTLVIEISLEHIYFENSRNLAHTTVYQNNKFSDSQYILPMDFFSTFTISCLNHFFVHFQLLCQHFEPNVSNAIWNFEATSKINAFDKKQLFSNDVFLKPNFFKMQCFFVFNFFN